MPDYYNQCKKGLKNMKKFVTLFCSLFLITSTISPKLNTCTPVSTITYAMSENDNIDTNYPLQIGIKNWLTSINTF